MGGRLDATRARLVGGGRASDERNHTLCGLVDVFDPDPLRDPPIAQVLRPATKRFVEGTLSWALHETAAIHLHFAEAFQQNTGRI